MRRPNSVVDNVGSSFAIGLHAPSNKIEASELKAGKVSAPYKAGPETRPATGDDTISEPEAQEACKSVGEDAPKDEGDEGGGGQRRKAENPGVELVGEDAHCKPRHDGCACRISWV